MFRHSLNENLMRHYVVIALLSAVSSARMRPWLVLVIPCGSRSVFNKPSLRHSLFLIGVVAAVFTHVRWTLTQVWSSGTCDPYFHEVRRSTNQREFAVTARVGKPTWPPLPGRLNNGSLRKTRPSPRTKVGGKT